MCHAYKEVGEHMAGICTLDEEDGICGPSLFTESLKMKKSRPYVLVFINCILRKSKQGTDLLILATDKSG